MNVREKTPPVFEVVAAEGLYAVHRNGRYLMTPAGKPFLLPTLALAEAVAEEWHAQSEKIEPATMPMTQLCATTLDIIRPDRAKTIAGLLAYVDSELLCHRTDSLGTLAERQKQIWQPFLDWCGGRYGVIFAVGCGVMPVRQKPEVTETLRKAVEGMDDFRLAGLSCTCDTAGSLVLGLALEQGFCGADAVLTAAELDSAHQASLWGEDPVAQNRRASVGRDLESCERWFRLLRQ